jgi:GrpB-like predicted nucleotidyltransferase (UPF0157 family)
MVGGVGTDPIIVVEYDPRWAAIYERLSARIADALGELAAAVEHVGSTAVANLAAKPIIDIDVLLTARATLSEAVCRLEQIGYGYRGDLGIRGREAFRAPENEFRHHLYVCPADSSEFRRHLAFRDYLRTHPEEAKRYAAIKKSLAERFRNDRVAYNEGKGAYVEEILSRGD